MLQQETFLVYARKSQTNLQRKLEIHPNSNICDFCKVLASEHFFRHGRQDVLWGWLPDPTLSWRKNAPPRPCSYRLVLDQGRGTTIEQLFRRVLVDLATILHCRPNLLCCQILVESQRTCGGVAHSCISLPTGQFRPFDVLTCPFSD